MERRRFLKVALATSVGPFLIPAGASAQGAPFETIGLYCSLPTDLPPKDSNTYDFFKACGYNYLEFCEAGFRYRPDLLPDYYEQMSHAVNLAHEKGFRVGIVLLAGMEQWKGPGKIGYAGTFSTIDQPKLAERLVHLRREVSLLKNADAFIVIPGDPGGDPKGRTTLNDCITFCRHVQDIVKEEAPGASFSVNLWGVAEWEGFPSAFSLRFWQQEANLSRRLVSSDLLGLNCGVAFPLHNYYRPLTLALYSKAGIQPDPYPTLSDIQRLRTRGVKPLLGWPYFLVDEADEGYMSPNNVESGGQSSAETRYIRALVDTGHRIGLDGLVANAIFFQAESLNIYAFGQMCRSDLSPGQVLDKYAGFIADEKSRASLGGILRYIENNSNWQNSFPVSYRLRELDVPQIDSASAALKLLAQVKPCERPAIPLLEGPTVYLGRLKRRLEAIAAGKIGGVSNDLNN
ncbi:MAG TPA: hypothetical protein VFO29_08925 [Candidatus Rubrimentiphilum sp.]|nr:hypothetical protein [Candidatus Rubrimentiphilum sp.]